MSLGNPPKAALHNLGCKVNAYELEAMQQLLEQAGYRIVPFEPGADVYVINTCTVTNIADRKSRQMLHRARKMNPDAIVVAAGCYAQTGSDTLKKDETVDIVLGNNQKGRLVEALEAFRQTREKSLQVIPAGELKQYEPLQIRHTTDRLRAFIKVTDGCNQFCSYCLIPYARGRVRSRRLSDVRAEIEAIALTGRQEVVLTGIHLSSYGTDLREEGKPDLLSLIREAAAVPGIRRIRLGSLEPGIITEEFAAALSGIPAVCPHFHLSLQSGCEKTLRKMNRHYTPAEFEKKCGVLRRYFKDPALTTDIIAGFPGESEQDFLESCAFVERIGFYETHIFKYSLREGTRAAGMPDQVPEPEKARRSDILLALNERRIREYEMRRMGEPLSVLMEEEIETGHGRWLMGHSTRYVPVCVPAGAGTAPGCIVTVRPDGFLQKHLLKGVVSGDCILQKSRVE